MAYRRETQRAGFCRVFFRHSEGYFDIPLADFDTLDNAIKAGEAWYRGTDLYGCRVTFRVSDVVQVSESTAESVATYDAEQDALHAYEQLHGTPE